MKARGTLHTNLNPSTKMISMTDGITFVTATHFFAKVNRKFANSTKSNRLTAIRTIFVIQGKRSFTMHTRKLAGSANNRFRVNDLGDGFLEENSIRTDNGILKVRGKKLTKRLEIFFRVNIKHLTEHMKGDSVIGFLDLSDIPTVRSKSA